MIWYDFISDKRITEKEKGDAVQLCSEMESDYHRIIKSASFRRRQDKTQVLPLDQSDFVRARLTHSLEAASLAKMIGKQVCQKIQKYALEKVEDQPDLLNVVEILNCAGSLHDIGNPAFGHFGESAIRKWLEQNMDTIKYQRKTFGELLDDQQKYVLCNFKGNAQALRIVI